jgi:nitrile hydratase accessory protein
LRPPAEPERPFEQPWHAELFATTHALARTGFIDWADWSAWFALALGKADDAGAPRDGSAYYTVWLDALEDLLVAREIADRRVLSDLSAAWTDAYLSTPHGQPVELPSRLGGSRALEDIPS